MKSFPSHSKMSYKYLFTLVKSKHNNLEGDYWFINWFFLWNADCCLTEGGTLVCFPKIFYLIYSNLNGINDAYFTSLFKI